MKDGTRDIRLILYVKPDNRYREYLLTDLYRQFSEDQVACHGSIMSLEEDFRTIDKRKKIILIFITHEEEPQEIGKIKHLFSNSSLIIILPSQKDGLILEVSALYPRYISFSKENFADVNEVLEKMIKQM